MFKLDAQLEADTLLLGHFPLCQVRLMKDAQYPWVILVPARAQVKEIFHLSESDQNQLIKESSYVSEKLADAFEADSMNVAALGNQVAQLHVHHVVRKETDACWPKPIWGASPIQPYSDEALEAMTARLSSMFAEHFVEAPNLSTPDELY